MAETSAHIVYEGIPGASSTADGTSATAGTLFKGLKFWVAMRCPSRSQFISDIKSNGGTVVPLESQADYLIADHLRKDAPPGSTSYKFIEASISEGSITDVKQFPAGPESASIREVGSIRPAKSSRQPFTTEDDRQLFQWVKECERKGGKIRGNEIYKQLEQANGRHTWQSWRDRYIKTLSVKPPATYVPVNAPPSPAPEATNEPTSDSGVQAVEPVPEEQRNTDTGTGEEVSNVDGNAESKPGPSEDTVADTPGFTQEDFRELYQNAERIQNSTVKEYVRAWGQWAMGTAQSAQQWREYFEKTVEPQWSKDHPEPRGAKTPPPGSHQQTPAEVSEQTPIRLRDAVRESYVPRSPGRKPRTPIQIFVDAKRQQIKAMRPGIAISMQNVTG